MALTAKNPPANAGSIPGSGRSPAGGHGNPLQCLFVLLRSYASFLGILSLCCCVGNSIQLRCAGPSLRRPLQLWGTEFQAHGFSRFSSRAPEGRLCAYGPRAQLLRSMWDPPGPGIEAAAPAVQGGLPTTGPARKSPTLVLLPGEPHGQGSLVGYGP